MLGRGIAATDFGMALNAEEALHASKSSMFGGRPLARGSSTLQTNVALRREALETNGQGTAHSPTLTSARSPPPEVFFMATVLSLVHAVALGLLSPLPGLYPPSKVAPLPPSPRHYQRTRAPLLAASPPPPSSKITVRKPQELLRRLKPAAAGEEEPPWLRVLARLKPPLVRLLARLKPLLRILARLKPLVPVLAALVFLMVQMARRTARAPRPVEVSYAAFMTLVTTQAASISDLRISLSRYNFMLNGQPAYTLPARLAPDVAFFLHRSGVDFRAAATSGLASLVPLWVVPAALKLTPLSRVWAFQV